MKYVSIILISFISMGGMCKKCSVVTHYCGIQVHNNSSRTIVTCLGYKYPDISIPMDSVVGGLLPGRFRILDTRGRCDDVFEALPKDTINIFIFDLDSVLHYSWQQIRSGYKILKRYDLSRQDLASKNYVITYP
jgi:hypothetical protein